MSHRNPSHICFLNEREGGGGGGGERDWTAVARVNVGYSFDNTAYPKLDCDYPHGGYTITYT